MKTIVLYGCGPQNSDKLTPVGKFVTEAAAKLFHQSSGKIKIISTGGKTGQSSFSEAQVMTKELIRLGVPKKCIVLEPNATNTIENLVFVANIVDMINLDHLIHVTTNIHMPQVKELCKLTGLEKISSYTTADEIIKHEIDDARAKNIGRWMRGLREIPLYWLPQITKIENIKRWKHIICQPRVRDFLKEKYGIAYPEKLSQNQLFKLQEEIKKEKRIMP